MPVTIKPAGHGAESVRPSQQPAKDPLDFLKGACPNQSRQCKELMQSSFGPNLQAAMDPSSNGFVHGAIQAYNQHHCLHIRPEDVWFAILSQLSFFINAHAEELRGQFVAHEGKKELIIKFCGNRYSVDYALFAKRMGALIEENVVDPELRQWMMPAFTTTTKNDIVVACILLMGATQKYFDFTCRILCGLPSVTLLGNKGDWELILARLEKLKEYGEEPVQFYTLLKPVVSRFVDSFDSPMSDGTVAFWQRIAHHESGGSGPSYYSGWITAFCFWSAEGKSMYYTRHHPDCINESSWEKTHELKLDEAIYHKVESTEVPPGYTEVPVKVDDNGNVFHATMIAGSVGTRYISSQGAEHDMDTIQPESGWWMFEKKEEAEKLGHDSTMYNEKTESPRGRREKLINKFMVGRTYGRGKRSV
ncbi:MAG: hypothetical protein Q9173_007071 [Seirophora scorigena]